MTESMSTKIERTAKKAKFSYHEAPVKVKRSKANKTKRGVKAVNWAEPTEA